MDGELVILDEQGGRAFSACRTARASDAPRRSGMRRRNAGTLYLFDLMAVEGFDLRSCRS